MKCALCADLVFCALYTTTSGCPKVSLIHVYHTCVQITASKPLLEVLLVWLVLLHYPLAENLPLFHLKFYRLTPIF